MKPSKCPLFKEMSFLNKLKNIIDSKKKLVGKHKKSWKFITHNLKIKWGVFYIKLKSLRKFNNLLLYVFKSNLAHFVCMSIIKSHKMVVATIQNKNENILRRIHINSYQVVKYYNLMPNN